MRTLLLFLQLWKGASGPFTVEWTDANLSAYRTTDPAHPIFDARQDAETTWKKLSRDPKVGSLGYTFRLLSVVGPVLSYEESENCACGGAHPSAFTRFHAVDLNTGRPVKIDTLFAPNEIFRALAADRIVRKALPPGAHPQTLPALLKALEFQSVTIDDCSYLFTNDILDSFAFYDIAGPRVAVRLSLPHAVETCRGSMTQLGIWLPIPKALEVPLKQARLMKQAPETSTEIEFSK